MEVTDEGGTIDTDYVADITAGAEVEAFEGLQALALRDPRKVIVGLSGFQQFFLI